MADSHRKLRYGPVLLLSPLARGRQPLPVAPRQRVRGDAMQERAQQDREDHCRFQEHRYGKAFAGLSPDRARLRATGAIRTMLRLNSAYSHARQSQCGSAAGTMTPPKMRKTTRLSSCPSASPTRDGCARSSERVRSVERSAEGDR